MTDENSYNDKMEKMEREQYVRQMKEAAKLLEAGDGKAAIPILERLAQLYPNDIDVALNLGGAYILSKRWALAIEVLEIASLHDPGNPAVWSNLGAAYLGTLAISTKDKQDKAIAAFRRVIELQPYYPNTHYNLGLIYEDRGDLVNAREMFAQAIKVNPADRDARALHARAERILKQLEAEANAANGLSAPPTGDSTINLN
jgi:tetratricopeptide (TPR) repeat protein